MKLISIFMKFIFIIVAILGIAYSCNAQSPVGTPAQKVNAFYEFLGVKHDSVDILPRSGPSAHLDSTGAVYLNTTDKKIHWHYSPGHDTTFTGGGGAQDLETTLGIGRWKNNIIADSIVVDTFGYTTWKGYPSNYNTSYAPFGKGKNFSIGWQRFNGVNITIPRPNVVGNYWMYNATNGGGIDDTAEQAGFRFATETFFNLNFAGRGTTELHLPEFYANHGQITIRPNSYYIDNLTGSVQSQHQIQSENWNTKNTNADYYSFGANTSNHDSTISVNQSVIVSDDAPGGSSYDRHVSYNSNDWASFDELYERGSMTYAFDVSRPSVNNWTFAYNGHVFVDGTGFGSSSTVLRSSVDQPTTNVIQEFAGTFNQAPTFLLDRRDGSGNAVLGDGRSNGHFAWNANQSSWIDGIQQGTSAGGTQPCIRVEIHSIDSTHSELITFTSDPSGNVKTPIHSITGPYLFFNPSTGGTVNAIAGYNIIDPPLGNIATLTINMPGSPVDGQVCEFKYISNVAAITYTGGTVRAQTTATAGYVKMVFNSSNTTWY